MTAAPLWRYLPFPCYLCGRQRLEYNSETGEVACEKCGADAEVLSLEVEEAQQRKRAEQDARIRAMQIHDHRGGVA